MAEPIEPCETCAYGGDMSGTLDHPECKKCRYYGFYPGETFNTWLRWTETHESRYFPADKVIVIGV